MKAKNIIPNTRVFWKTFREKRLAALRSPDDLFSGFVFEASLRQSRCTGIAVALFFFAHVWQVLSTFKGPWKHTWLGVHTSQFDKSVNEIYIYTPILLLFTYGHGPFVTERASSHFQGGGPPDLGVELFGIKTWFGHTKSKQKLLNLSEKNQVALAEDFSELSTHLPSKLHLVNFCIFLPRFKPSHHSWCGGAWWGGWPGSRQLSKRVPFCVVEWNLVCGGRYFAKS